MPDGHDRTTSKPSAATSLAADSQVAAADLAAIDGLIDRLVPALTAKLGASHLGELEVRQGEWRVRLRRPAAAGWNGELRRAADRHGARGDGAAARAEGGAHRVATPGGSNGTGHAPSHGPGHHADEDQDRKVVTSPAVGVFRPNARATVGTRVRQGDVLGHVDVLGVREDVLASSDGLVGEVIAEAGTAVEFGQELLVLALATSGAGASGSGATGDRG